MDDSDNKFSPTDLIRLFPLLVGMGLVQSGAAYFGIDYVDLPTEMERWYAASSLGILPGFLLGLILQRLSKPDALSIHKQVVIFLGLVSVIFFVLGAFMLAGMSPFPFPTSAS